jgi:hypothetical protein
MSSRDRRGRDRPPSNRIFITPFKPSTHMDQYSKKSTIRATKIGLFMVGISVALYRDDPNARAAFDEFVNKDSYLHEICADFSHYDLPPSVSQKIEPLAVEARANYPTMASLPYIIAIFEILAGGEGNVKEIQEDLKKRLPEYFE